MEADESVMGEYDSDGDGIIDHRTLVHGWREAGFKVMSEDGTVIQTITSDREPSWGDGGVFKLNNKYYLVLSDGDETEFYKINPTTSDISKMQTVPSGLKTVHTLDGIRHKSMQRGVNIVRDADGRVTKRLVK